MDRLELDRPGQSPERRGPAHEAVVVVRDQDDRLAGLSDRVDDRADSPGVLPPEEVVRLVEDHELPPARRRGQEVPRIGEGLRDGSPQRDLAHRLRVPPVRGVHLDDRPAHVPRQRQGRARLPRPRRAGQDHGAPVRDSLLPRKGPLLELRDGGGVPHDVSQRLRAVVLRPRRHCETVSKARLKGRSGRGAKPAGVAILCRTYIQVIWYRYRIVRFYEPPRIKRGRARRLTPLGFLVEITELREEFVVRLAELQAVQSIPSPWYDLNRRYLYSFLWHEAHQLSYWEP